MKPERKKLLEQLKKADLKADVPSVSEPNAEFLHNLVLSRQCTSGLEIGTAHAYSTIWLGDAFEKNGGHLTTIEHSPPSFNQAKVNLYRAKLEKSVTQHQGRAQKVIQSEFDSSTKYDFIFIDGIKKSTLEFFEIASPLLTLNGVIVIDDVLKFKSKMQSFYDWIENQSLWTYSIEKLDKDDGIMIVNRS
ncbi:hypothetical protein GW756_01815 [bacterium]|nr:hypothetical protein [bacterium]NCQ55092.1 hypothetical protein [Candidatus Parcubacteria bacterium]NCS67136.1 hypothetical protein [Candidatus Peregrinibacteria bacterium]NCS96082.1 hypothetical protein [bacterium]